MIHKTFLTIDVEVDFDANPAIPGKCDGAGGPKLEPDEPAHIIINAVKLLGTETEYEVTPEQQKELEDEIAGMLADKEQGLLEDYWDSLRERDEERG